VIFSQVKSDISRLGGTTAESWVASRTWHALRACQALPSSETRLARCWCTTQLYAPSLAVSVSVADVTSPRLLPTFALHVPWQLPYQLPLSLPRRGVASVACVSGSSVDGLWRWAAVRLTAAAPSYIFTTCRLPRLAAS